MNWMSKIHRDKEEEGKAKLWNGVIPSQDLSHPEKALYYRNTP